MPTSSAPGEPLRRRPLEPSYVQQRKRAEALADLLRSSRLVGDPEYDPDKGYVPVEVAKDRGRSPEQAEDDTEVLEPVRDSRQSTAPRGKVVDYGRQLRVRRAAALSAVGLAALAGFGAAAFLLPQGADDTRPEARPSVSASASAPVQNPVAPDPTTAPPQGSTDPDGPGTLRQGSQGPAVTELQERLLRIPNVYENGSVNGRYDATLTDAVARFQLWYGIRGDETGVYGNDTRRDLESRTTL
ncbi:peptidoglycan-binding domain-containing protein [Streptomyces cavernae]|uniref:peptidoglycan-binding domain-containing protein n=1 Tax=Streptomyces cavernae TaxID=2259034 RepID=UPI001EE41F1E|nr:peptidoglycan-binding domain-containing protein [Streptomyces cavernae]